MNEFYYMSAKNKYQQLMKREEKDDGIMDGFSSEEELKHEQIKMQETKQMEKQQLHKEQVKFKIPPPQQIKKKTYSLHPDMATGWAPKSDLPVPIPIVFSNRRIDSIIKKFVQKPCTDMKLCFLGPRFENTFYAWYDRPFAFPYSHIKSPHNMKFTNRAFCGQHWDAEDGLIFDSFFESGNLDCAIRVGERQYDLYIRVDSNTRGHLQWFNFKMKNMEKLQKYKINICNFQKNKSLYSRGQKPYVFSQKKFEKEKKGWQQMGNSIKYQQKSGKSAKVLSHDFNSYFKLSFDFYTEYSNDEVQIAYCVPYTYTQLTKYISDLQQRCSGKSFLQVSKLCTSLGGLEVPLLIIHEDEKIGKNFKEIFNDDDEFKIPKKCVVVSGRAHPGQSNGSYMMEGFLDFICGMSKQAIKLRKDFIFKIVPMLNPDGVALGNYRTGISGKDFNRQYRNPDKTIFPQVYSFKKLVTDNKAIYRQNLLMFLDFHGHSIKKNVFMYGPQFPIIQRHYYECRVFPKILGNTTPMFRYYSCSFKISQCKVTTARAVLLRKLMIPFSYTIEASNGSYYDHQLLKDVPFTDSSWIKMGKQIGVALSEYAQMVILSEKIRLDKLRQKKMKKEMKLRNRSVKGRKNSFNHQKQQQQTQLSIFSTQNAKIKRIFQEIRKAEEEKEFSKIEDDDISEGSSDGQGEKDDLSAQKLGLLYQIIKNKKNNSNGPEKNRKKFSQEQTYRTAKTTEQQTEKQMKKSIRGVKQIEAQLQFPIENEQIFKNNGNLRGYLLRNKNNQTHYLGDHKKEKVAAKIINFSFIGHHRPSHSIEKKKMSNKSEIQYEQMGKQQSRDLVQELLDNRSMNVNSKVLDLSDNNFRKHVPGRALSKDSERKNVMYANISPRKLAGRMDEFKYRRLLIDEFKI